MRSHIIMPDDRLRHSGYFSVTEVGVAGREGALEGDAPALASIGLQLLRATRRF